MIITRTPYRISLFGGGSDLPIWYKNNDGLVVSFSINKYCYIFCRELPPFFDYNYRLTYSKVETVLKIDDIMHPALREAIRHHTDPKIRLEIQHHGDLPARSGVGSSSAFAVGLISALSSLDNKELTKYDLASKAIDLEQIHIAETVGSQDQIACSFGGFNSIRFSPGGSWKIDSLRIDRQRLNAIEDRCYLVYSQIARFSSEISKGLVNEFEKKHDNLLKTVNLAEQSLNILESNTDLDEIGELLNEGWELKKELNPFSTNNTIKTFIENGKANGALGAKVLGAGGGGFILFWLKEGDKERFRNKFKMGVQVPFKIEFEGSSIIRF